MEITIREEHGLKVAVIQSELEVITDVQSALDFIATVAWETGCYHIILNKAAIIEDFFDLSTRLAGEILQKFTTYEVKVAIVGDFSAYTSKSLQDFIRESNQGRQVFFVAHEDEAMEKLGRCM